LGEDIEKLKVKNFEVLLLNIIDFVSNVNPDKPLSMCSNGKKYKSP